MDVNCTVHIELHHPFNCSEHCCDGCLHANYRQSIPLGTVSDVFIFSVPELHSDRMGKFTVII